MEPLDLSNLPNYTGDAGAQCPKCGHQDVGRPHATTWVSGTTNMYPGGELHWGEASGNSIQPGCLMRSCGRCNYGWPERTADNPAPTGG